MSLSDIICPYMSFYAIICGTKLPKVSIICTKTANFGRVDLDLVKPKWLVTTRFVPVGVAEHSSSLAWCRSVQTQTGATWLLVQLTTHFLPETLGELLPTNPSGVQLTKKRWRP
jgi:hypothetical protein